VGENPVLYDPNATHVEEAIQRLEFLVCQDIFLNETNKYADVILPAASFAEKNGTFTNTERRVQLIRKAIEPVGDSRPDWWITAEIGKRMGVAGFDFEDAPAIFDEIARLTPSYGGMNYERLEGGGLAWPCPTPEHPGTQFLHRDRFTRGKGLFSPLSYRPSAELPDEEYPLVLTTGRNLYQFHTGTMTRKTRGINQLSPEERTEIHPKDAEMLGIADGDPIQIASRRGAVTARARVTDDVPPGVIFMTFHFWESAANVLTNDALDPIAKIPEYKVCAVRVERVSVSSLSSGERE
jgi:predicted molibdopterin-dependent oxidoreductase YjgC